MRKTRQRVYAHHRLTMRDRLKIEAMYNKGISVQEIAEYLGKHQSSIYAELKQGFYMHRNSDWTETKKYSADIAEVKARYNSTTKGASLKIGNDHEYLAYLAAELKKKKSPQAILAGIKKQGKVFKTHISLSTFYNYIRNGIFLTVSVRDLPFCGKRLKPKKTVKAAKTIERGTSIEKRSPSVLTRQEFGHWEFDTVIGKRNSKQVLYVFTERKTRMEIIVRGKDKTALTAVRVLNKLERAHGRHFSKIFKTITCDNGVEFSNFRALEKSCRHKGSRTSFYFCHPFCSSERGSNENQNRFIRRFIPKGTAIEDYTDEYIKYIEDFINEYPRGMFNFANSKELFLQELQKLHIFL